VGGCGSHLPRAALAERTSGKRPVNPISGFSILVLPAGLKSRFKRLVFKFKIQSGQQSLKSGFAFCWPWQSPIFDLSI
jgi:hypothetical protein